MSAGKKTGFKGSLIVSLLCTVLVWGWNMQFGSVAGRLASSIVHHGWKATFPPDHYSLSLLGIFLGFYGVKRMIRSLQKDAWERSKQLLPDAFVLPPA
jgi:cell division protein FtsX